MNDFDYSEERAALVKCLRYYMDGAVEHRAANCIEHLELRVRKLETALEALLEKYTQLVNCGDCGNWDPELEDEVIQARGLLKSS